MQNAKQSQQSLKQLKTSLKDHQITSLEKVKGGSTNIIIGDLTAS